MFDNLNGSKNAYKHDKVLEYIMQISSHFWLTRKRWCPVVIEANSQAYICMKSENFDGTSKFARRLLLTLPMFSSNTSLLTLRSAR